MVNAQKNRLISETLRVAQKLGRPEAIRQKLEQALKEREFSRAVETIKDAIPESLLVDSQNPLKLLHDALSIGVHQESDCTCLAAARAVRLVLADFAERLRLALRDQAELRSAIGEVAKFVGEARKKSGSGESSS